MLRNPLEGVRAAARVLRALHSTAPPPPPSAASYPLHPLPVRRANPSRSRSRYAERRGAVHGALFRQYKGDASGPPRPVPRGLALPPYALGEPPPPYPEPQVHDAAGVARMRHASAVAAEVLARAGELVRPGATGDQIDDLVHALTVRAGAYPSPRGYAGFPRSVCVSVNEVVCHGIPDDCVIMPGDVVSVDVSAFVGGVHGDTCRTWIAGGDAAGDAPARELVRATKGALDAAVRACGPGVRVAAIGEVVAAAAAAARLDVVASYSGHGIGEVFHTQPIVHHVRNDSPYVLREGMTFTIEPMLVEGSADVALWPDGWAVVTLDGGRAAQFEHTLLVTQHGVDVLTHYPEG